MKSDEVLKEIEQIAQLQFLPIIGSEKGKLLEKLVRAKKPRSALEIGTLIGYSAIRVARNLPKKSKLICIEVNPHLAEIAHRNISRAGIRTIRIIVGDAKKVVPTLKKKFDFVFIDALKEEYFEYLKAVEKKLSKKAMIVADNAGVFAQEMEDYLKYIRTSGKFKNKTHYVNGDAMEVSIRI